MMGGVVERMMLLAERIADTERSISTLSRFGDVRREMKRQLVSLKREFDLLGSILVYSGGAA